MTLEQKLLVANVVVYGLTFLAVAWYSIETRWLRQETAALRQEAVRQTHLQVRPFITLDFVAEHYCFRLWNIGAGVARDVQIEDLPLPHGANEAPSTIRWDPVDFISPPNGTRETTSHLWIADEEYGPTGAGDAA